MYNEHCNRLHKDYVKFTHLSNLVREMAKNCRNEKYENLKIQCKDGDLRLNQVIALLIIPELIYVDTLASQDTVLVPDVTIQAMHSRMQCLFQSMNKDLDSKISEINSDPFYMLFRPQHTAKLIFSSSQTPSFSLPQSPLIPLSLATSLVPSLAPSLAPSPTNNDHQNFIQLPSSLQDNPPQISKTVEKIINEELVNKFPESEMIFFSESQFSDSSPADRLTSSGKGLRLTAAPMSGANELICSTSNLVNLNNTSVIPSKEDSMHFANLRSSEKNNSYQRQPVQRTMETRQYHHNANPIFQPHEGQQGGHEGHGGHLQVNQVEGKQNEYPLEEEPDLVDIDDGGSVEGNTSAYDRAEDTSTYDRAEDTSTYDRAQDTSAYDRVYGGGIGTFESEYYVADFDERKKGNTYVDLVPNVEQQQVYVDIGNGLLEECRTTPLSVNQDQPLYSSSDPGNSSSIPGTSSSIPGTSSSIPENRSSIPGTSSSIPENSSSIPENSSSIPGDKTVILERPENETVSEQSILLSKGKKDKNTDKRSSSPKKTMVIPTEMIKCDTCHKIVQRRNLKRHELIHSSSPKYSCKICDKEFSRAVHLNNHNKVHSSEKSFKCDTCGKCFILNSLLNKHKKIHAARVFKCVECDKVFITNVKLERHMRSHKEEKNYKCEVCSSSFNRIDNLKKHLKKSHGVQLPDLREHKLTSQLISTNQ